MFSFKRNARLLYVFTRRYREISSFNRAFSCCQVSNMKEPSNKKKNVMTKKKKQHKHDAESDTTVPIAVQMLSKKLNVPLDQKSAQRKAILSEEELRNTLEEISWDAKAAIYQHKQDSSLTNEGQADDSFSETQIKHQGYTEEDFYETIMLDDEHMRKTETKQNNKGQKIVGSPDPSVPKSKIPCSGCGAELHCQDPIIPGYLPSEKFKSLTKNDLRQSVCQRCHLMSNHNIYLNVKVDASDYPNIISRIKGTRGLVIVIVDLTDIRNSIFPNLLKYIGTTRPIYVIGNKVDLIPKDDVGYLTRIKGTLIEECEIAGLNKNGRNIKHACLVSAKTGYGIEELVTKLMSDWKLEGEVFLVGCTNVGKSSVFNALLQSDYCKSHVRDIIKRATVSVWPGTTLNLLKFPIVNPEAWRVFLRVSRLKQERSKKHEERKIQESKLKSERKTKYATLHGYIGQTDFRGQRERRKEQKEKESEFQGQELVSFSMSNKGNLSEVSGRHHIAEETTPDMSALNALMPSRWTFDTPGAVNPEQIINSLTPEELQLVLPRKLFQPKVFLLNPSQTMLVSGLGRIDYCQGERSVFLTVHCSPALPVHVLDTKDADDFLEKHLGSEILAVPINSGDRPEQLPALIGQELYLTGIGWDRAVADVQLSSLGWVSAMIHRDHEVMLKAYTPGGRGCHIRTPALLPNVLSFRGERIKGTAGYARKHLKFPREG